ncbi:MAG: VTT domain-containing protein [Glaciecola sp.]
MSFAHSVKKRAKRLIHSKKMLSGIGVASFLESTIVPIPLETILVPLMQSRREKLWLIAGITTLGCLAGALLGYVVGYYLFDALQQYITQYIASESQITQFQNTMKKEGFWFIFSTGVTPVPLQIAMLAAGLSKYSLALYMLAVATSRIIRYFGLALLVYYFGNKTEKLIKKYKWQVGALGLSIVAAIIAYKVWSFY